MNTKINYLYRDADNYKVPNECIIRGGMTEKQEKRIVDSLDDGQWFIPAQVGMAEKKFDTETEADHSWFEWGGIEPTAQAPTLDIDAEELAARFEKASNGWWPLPGKTVPNDGRVPYCVTIQETLSRTVVIWAHDRSEAEENAHELCSSGEIDLDAGDFAERQCTCDGVATEGDLKAFKEYHNIQ